MERATFDGLLLAALPQIERAGKTYAAKYRLLHEWPDLSQTALLKMLEAADLYNPGKGELLPWACVIIINTIKTRLIEIYSRPYFDELTPIIANCTPSHEDTDPEHQAQVSFILSHISEEVRLMTEGYNYQEIALRCGFRSKVTAMNRIDNSTCRLSHLLGIPYERSRRTRMYARTADR